MTSSTAELRAETLHVVAGLDPDLMTGEQAARVVADLATVEKSAASGRMSAALRVAKTEAWRGQGHASAADWLAAQMGISVREAHAQLGTARKAARMPKTKKAMDDGELSPDQAAAVTDGASADPDAEDDLLDAAANDTHAGLKDKAAKAKAAATDSAERERRVRRDRALRTRTNGDGAGTAWLQGPAVNMAKLQALMKPFEEQVFRHGRSNGSRDTFDARKYDAFFAMLGHHTGTDFDIPGAPAPALAPAPAPAPAPASEPAAAPPTSLVPAAKLPGGNNTKVIVLIDHQALLRGYSERGETSEVVGLGPVPVSAVRDMMQDAFLAAVVKSGRDVMNVAHLGHSLTAHQRTAIEALGLRCTNIACNRNVAIQIDHRVPYATEPITELHNQDPLCPECHPKKTHHGWELEKGEGPRRFLPPEPQTNTHGTKRQPGDPPGPDPNRILTKEEADELEDSLRARLGLPSRAEQPRLC